jgi:hypothetical protein
MIFGMWVIIDLSRKKKMLWPGQENTIYKTIIWLWGQRSRFLEGHYSMQHTALCSCIHIQNIILTLFVTQELEDMGVIWTPLATETGRYGIFLAPCVTETRRYGVIMKSLVTLNWRICCNSSDTLFYYVYKRCHNDTISSCFSNKKCHNDTISSCFRNKVS